MAEGQNNTNTELIKAINALSQACSTLTTQIKSVDSTVQASTKATEDNTDSQEKSTDITKKTVENFEQGSKSDQIILTMSEMLSKAGIKSKKTQEEMNEYLKTLKDVTGSSEIKLTDEGYTGSVTEEQKGLLKAANDYFKTQLEYAKKQDERSAKLLEQELKQKEREAKQGLTKDKVQDALGGSFEDSILSGFLKDATSQITGITEGIAGSVVGVVGSAIAKTIESIWNIYTDAMDALVKNFGGQIDQVIGVYDKMAVLETKYFDAGWAWSDAIEQASNLDSFVYTGIEYLDKYEKLVSKGIQNDTYGETNLHQMAKSLAILEKVAPNLSYLSTSMWQLYRLQQEDSIHYRAALDMSLNSYLTELTHSTEYLSDIAQSVITSLQSAESLLSADAAVETEFQIQKWLGLLYNKGANNSTITSITQAINALGSGDTSKLTSGGTGTLLAKAAASAGLDYSSMILNGLNPSDMNALMQSVILELANAYNSDNNVVRNRLANIYGVGVEDLVAANNLITTLDLTSSSVNQSVTSKSLLDTYNDVFSEESILKRTSETEIIKNLSDMIQFKTAANLATNADLLMTYKIGGWLGGDIGSLLKNTAITTSGVLDQAMVDTQANWSGAADPLQGILGNMYTVIDGGLTVLKTITGIVSTISDILTSIKDFLVKIFSGLWGGD